MQCAHKFRSFLILLIAIVAIITLTACGSLRETITQATHLRDQTAAARANVAAQLASLEQTQTSIPPGTPERSEADAAIALANAKLAALDAAVLHADLVLQEMTHPTDSLTQGVGSIAPFLPAPAQGPALLGAALIATLLRAHQVRKGAGSIAASIQKAMGDPAFKQAFEAQANTIRSIQTPAARRIVDQETRPGTGLKLPI